MTPKQRRFVAEYLISLNATQAAIQAGYAAKHAYQIGHETLRKPEVAAAIETARVEVAQKLEISLDRILLDAWAVLTADARDLVEYRVGCCRYCHGEGHRRQRTTAELDADFAHWTEQQHKPAEEFDAQGGIGFDAQRQPAADCPECFGYGVGHVVMHDTRHLSPAAALLYAGMKRTKEGMQLLLRDKDAARETLMKHLGGYLKDNEQKRTPLAEALGAFIGQLHNDEAGKLQHAPGLRVVPGGERDRDPNAG